MQLSLAPCPLWLAPDAIRTLQVVKQALADASSLEHGVVSRAGARMRQIAHGLDGVPHDAASSVADMARQVADILVMMRHEEVRVLSRRVSFKDWGEGACVHQRGHKAHGLYTSSALFSSVNGVKPI